MKYGPKVTRNRNAIDASLVEIGRLQKEVFPADSEMRNEICALEVGETKTFKIRSKEGRREVGSSGSEHFAAFQFVSYAAACKRSTLSRRSSACSRSLRR